MDSLTEIFTRSSTKLKSTQLEKTANRNQAYAVAIVKEGDTLEKLSKLFMDHLILYMFNVYWITILKF